MVANGRPDGDPLSLLLVSAPSTGKTEIARSVVGLPGVVEAATITEASLLSGTAKRDVTKEATGGLLRQIGSLGTIFCKDFTSVLSMNRDAARQALAALREVSDGYWHRAVGTDGGRVLKWSGKCSVLGCVTPSLDRHHSLMGTLGDRFLLQRGHPHERDQIARAALRGVGAERTMRADLAAAMRVLVESANLDQLTRELSDDETQWLTDLALLASQARTACERDGYTHEVLVLPELEGPGRLVRQLRLLFGGLESIGVDLDLCRDLVERVAVDCVPAIRTATMRALLAADAPIRTSAVAEQLGVVTKTAELHLEDLALLRIADRSKTSDAVNAPNLWVPSEWLIEQEPKVREKCTYIRV
ncbi:MAG TPA: hypothetical protein VNF75_06870 [Candidatus Dormibacteraeota bacterium]|nr:hypothetical protein [Candidatus Dormibacteraeota bacterium]